MLENTGERLVTELKNQTMVEHLHRYAMVSQYNLSNKVVLDVACGEGYGSHLLAQYAAEVKGIDISTESINHAKAKYQKSNLIFEEGDVTRLPLVDKSVDVIVSFETIEHHDQHDKMLEEFSRVLKEDGLVFISTPDKKYYTDLNGFKNPYHVKELYQSEFKMLMGRYFSSVQLFYQGVTKGTVLYRDDINTRPIMFYQGEYAQITSAQHVIAPVYLVAIASNSELPPFSDSVFQSRYVEKDYEFMYNEVMNSRTYQVGNMLLNPLRLLRNFFYGKRHRS